MIVSPYLLASSLTPADIGRRVVVRHHLPDGSATDVLGELESYAESLAVRRRDGSVAVVPAVDVLAGKVVPATWARDAAVGELQRIASDGWPALERERLGGWELRAAGGWTKRANSLLPIGSPGVPLDAALIAVRSWYAARGLPAVVLVPLPLCEALDDELSARGWALGTAVDVLVADLPRIRRHPGIDVVVADHPSDDWLRTFPDASPVGERVLDSGRAVFASAVVDGVTVGGVRGSLDERWLGITALNVATAHRRRGIARALVSSVADWAAHRGARHAYLQVERDNAAAQALYAEQGFTFHHSYVYRVAP
ncbi:MAG: N-acetylglutamate synthase [Frankiaceae bacterium]|nr:N-acetylglutamate synthase [Frankiaceae bacterium]